MKRYEEIYSVTGLKNLIKQYETKIAEKEKEYENADELYDPLKVDGWRAEIRKQIQVYKSTLKELNEALEEKHGVKDKLIEVLEKCETKQLAKIFEEYMKGQGVRKYDSRRKDNSNSYLVDGNTTGWNRAECFYYKDSAEYTDRGLLIVLRKRSGYYIIVDKGGTRAFEADARGVVHYDDCLLEEIMKEHKLLFDELLTLPDKSATEPKEVNSMKGNNKITPKEIYEAEATKSPIEFSRLKDIYDMDESVVKMEITRGENGMIAKIRFENSGESIVKVV